jgi:hypothetical protein
MGPCAESGFRGSRLMIPYESQMAVIRPYMPSLRRQVVEMIGVKSPVVV